MLPKIITKTTLNTLSIEFDPPIPTWFFLENNRRQFEFVVLSVIHGEFLYNHNDDTTATLVNKEVYDILVEWQDRILFPNKEGHIVIKDTIVI